MDAAAFVLLLTPEIQERSRPSSPPSPTKSFFPVYLNPPPSPRASTPRTLPPSDDIPPSDLQDLALASCTKRAIAKEVILLVSDRNHAKREKKSRDQKSEQRAFAASLESCRQAREEQERSQRLADKEAWEDVDEARRFIESFLHDQWEGQRGNIQVDCEFSIDMVGLTAIGAMKKKAGVKACMRLLAAPVIHEQVALSLWRTLVWRASGKEAVEDTEEEDVDDGFILRMRALHMPANKSAGCSSLTLRSRTEQRSMAASSDNVSMMTAPPWPRRALSGRDRAKSRPFIPRRASADSPGIGLDSPLKLTPLSSQEAPAGEMCAVTRQLSRPRKVSTNLNRAMSSFGNKIGHGYGGWLPGEEFSQSVVKGAPGEVETTAVAAEEGAPIV